mmetsp:Transcript_34907/g.74466  ORF Transcript_34907/g.74466 Transcript_34907/m.74466 type:complete len:128 (-) Transcript_34907:34-417(-)
MRNSQGSCGKKVATLKATLMFSAVKIADTPNVEDDTELRAPSSNAGSAAVVASAKVDDASVATSSIGANGWRRVEGERYFLTLGSGAAPCGDVATGAKADDGAPQKINDNPKNENKCIMLATNNGSR